MIPNFPHKAPTNYCYEFENFKRNVIAIWLRCDLCFDYNLGVPTRTIWGFWCSKTGKYYAPINSSKVGKEVRLEDTRNYSAMPLKLNPLEAAFV